MMKFVLSSLNLNLVAVAVALPLFFACAEDKSQTNAAAPNQQMTKPDQTGAYYEKGTYTLENGQPTEMMTWVDPNEGKIYAVCAATDPGSVTAMDTNNRSWGFENGLSCKNAADMQVPAPGAEGAAPEEGAPAPGQQAAAGGTASTR